MCCSVARIFIITALAKIILANEFEAFSSSQASATNYDNNCHDQYKTEGTEPTQPSTSPESEPSKNLEDEFNKGNLQFTSNFFYNVVKESPGTSVILSPYSTLILLAQLALYASGETVEQLFKALNLKNQNEIRSVIPIILDSINEQKNVTLDLAERIYGNIKSSFSDSFKKDSKDIFKAEAENIDFNDPQEAADIINKWVADNTNNKIKDLVPASVLTPDTELVLTNALYCLSGWRYKFTPDNTSPQNFYMSNNKTIIIDMMNQVEYFKYVKSDDLEAQAIELPYVNNNLTCLVLLPIDKDGATSLVTKLLDSNAITSIKSSLQSTKIDLSLPKFKTTTTINLKFTLEKLNVTELFNPNSNGLSDILAKPQNLHVSAGIQKADIEINESGSEAAAGNAIIGVAASAVFPTSSIPFTADHPFAYYLLFKGTPIFCGLFAGN